MKETEIAEMNIKEIKDREIYQSITTPLTICNVHKQTCQRWLEFLEKCLYPQLLFEGNTNGKELIKDKIIDLKQAIKLYEDAGI